jgi:hypothetical protein
MGPPVERVHAQFVEKGGRFYKVKGDLQRFKDFVEARGGETGAWRGEVDQDPTS